MAGRKRKAGDRYPSGKLKPAKAPTFLPITGAEYQRIRTAGLRIGADPRLASELARLNLFGELTVSQTTAGQRIGEIYGRYESLTGLKRSARSPSYERAYRSTLSDDASRHELLEYATDVFIALQNMLAPVVTAELLATIEELCVENRHVSSAWLPHLRAVLDFAAREFKIHNTAKGTKAAAPKRSAPAPTAQTPRPHRHEAFTRVIKTLRPDLTDNQVSRALETADALAQRDRFNAESPTLSRVTDTKPLTDVKLNRPLLTLPEKEGAK